jgi:sterol desaturase/sphingolipid hydroxylase (fatty acid hydroxylase superfamily)
MSHAHAHPNHDATAVPDGYQERLTSDRQELKELGPCFREFMRHFSGQAVAVAIAAVLVVRLVVGEWTWADALVPVVLVAAQPFVEWFIHKYLLHLKPMNIRGKKVDIYTARAHRRHHKDPSILDQTLLHPSEIIGSMVLIAFTAAPLFGGIVALLTGQPFFPLYLTALLFSYIGLYRYEWSHFLIHTPYIPKTRFFRSIWRNHRLHHFKHEDYWMGVTSNFGDRVLRTFPDQSTIKKSPTARNLGVETAGYDKAKDPS